MTLTMLIALLTDRGARPYAWRPSVEPVDGRALATLMTFCGN